MKNKKHNYLHYNEMYCTITHTYYLYCLLMEKYFNKKKTIQERLRHTSSGIDTVVVQF